MGIRLFVEVLDHAPDTLTWRERWALAVLAETANDGTRECWPGIEDDPVIAQRMRMPGRSSRYEVLRALRLKGALEGVSAGCRGRRAVYRIAVLRPEKGPDSPDAIDDEKGSGNAGPNEPEGSAESGPNEAESVREPRTQSTPKGPGTTDPSEEKGSGNDPQWVRERPVKGPGTTDPFPSDSSVPSSQPARESAAADAHAYGIPDAARPLVDALTAAGINVRWPFQGDQWFRIIALINKCGTDALVEHAARTARRAGDIDSARYFLRGWAELPPRPAPGTQRPPLRAVAGGWQPYANPTDQSVYENGF